MQAITVARTEDFLRVYKGDDEILMGQDFYRPVVIQRKDKVMNRASVTKRFDEKRKEIDRVLGRIKGLI